MMNLENLLNIRSNNKILLRIMAITALVGIADTIYLTANRYFGSEIKCLLTQGCDIVLNSRYSEFIGIPLAVWGLVFYAGFFILINMVDIYDKQFLVGILVVFGILGFVLSLILLSIQVFALGALCFYCLISFISSTILFILVIIFNRRFILQNQY